MDSEPGKVPFRIAGGAPLLVLVCAVVLVDSVGYGVVVPVVPLYAEKFGVGNFAIGFLFATYAIALFASAIPFGILSDRFGRKPFVLFGMFAMAGAFVFYALANSYSMLVLARALDGLTAAATWSAALALLGDRFEGGEMGAKMGWAMMAAAVGGIAGPLVGGILSDGLGHRSPFYAIGIACLLGGVAAVFLEDPPRRERTSSSGWEALKPVYTSRNLGIACIVTLVTTMGLGLLEPTMPLYLRNTFHLSTTGIGIVFGVTMLFYAAASPFAGRLSDAVGRKKPILAGLAATAFIAPFIAVFKNIVAVHVMMGLLGAAIAFFGTPSFPLVADALSGRSEPGEASRFGAAFGLLNVFWSLGYALGPLLGGALMEWAGLLAALLAYSLLLAALAVTVWAMLPGKEQPVR